MFSDEAVGGFVLMEKDDELWADRVGDSAFYVHKLVVGKEFSGRGYAGKILAWISDYAHAQGKDLIRIDYYSDRGYLARLYADCGFRPMGDCRMPDGTGIMRAERSITFCNNKYRR